MAEKFSIVEKLIDDPKFSILVKGLILTGLINKLNETGPFTIMAPSNLAFTKLPETKLIDLMKPYNKENLAETIKYHITNGKWMSEDIGGFAALMTIQNQTVKIEATDFGFRVNGANLQIGNIEASNGVIHGIDAVLFPAMTTEKVSNLIH